MLAEPAPKPTPPGPVMPVSPRVAPAVGTTQERIAPASAGAAAAVAKEAEIVADLEVGRLVGVGHAAGARHPGIEWLGLRLPICPEQSS